MLHKLFFNCIYYEVMSRRFSLQVIWNTSYYCHLKIYFKILISSCWPHILFCWAILLEFHYLDGNETFYGCNILSPSAFKFSLKKKKTFQASSIVNYFWCALKNHKEARRTFYKTNETGTFPSPLHPISLTQLNRQRDLRQPSALSCIGTSTLSTTVLHLRKRCFLWPFPGGEYGCKWSEGSLSSDNSW